MQKLSIDEISIIAAVDDNESNIHPPLLMYEVESARERKSMARACIIAR